MHSFPQDIMTTSDSPVVEKKSFFFQYFSPQVTAYFIAGGCAGAASRTVVSPLERLKIIQYVYLVDYLFAVKVN